MSDEAKKKRTFRHKEVRDAIQFVADNPKGREADADFPAWELVCRELFRIAHSPDVRVRGSMGRATKAQKMILGRLVGRRRPGTHPAQVSKEEVEFVDLTVGVLPTPAPKEEETDNVRV